MKKQLLILRPRLLLTGFLLAVALFALPETVQAAGFSGTGSGTVIDPYVITTPGQLNEVRNDLSAHYVLEADIDLSEYMNWLPIGDDKASFTGSLDGAGHTITGLHIIRPGTDRVGLFGFTSGASLTNITLKDALVSGRNYTGGLVGSMNGGSVIGCSFTGNARGNTESTSGSATGAGGLVGRVANGTISDCQAFGGVSGVSAVSGLVGFADKTTIRNSHTRMTVEGEEYIRGLAGEIYNTTSFSNCTATGSVRGDYAGGLVGYTFRGGTVSDCFSRGTVIVTGSVGGGLIGGNNSPVSGCLSLSHVISDGGTYCILGGLIDGQAVH